MKQTVTACSSRYCWAKARPTAMGGPAPTTVEVQGALTSGTARCRVPLLPRLQPVARPKISAMSVFASAPLASRWPWLRWLVMIASAGSSAAQTPAATPSWPVQRIIMPWIVPSMAQSSVSASSKRRVRSMARYISSFLAVAVCMDSPL